MNYLVDTHYLLWSLIDPSKINKHVTEILTDTQTIKYVSKINFWEIALKYSIGKLKLEGTTPEEILNASRESGFKVLDIAEDDIVTSHLLPFIAKHRDSFDRLVVWQCIKKAVPPFRWSRPRSFGWLNRCCRDEMIDSVLAAQICNPAPGEDALHGEHYVAPVGSITSIRFSAVAACYCVSESFLHCS